MKKILVYFYWGLLFILLCGCSLSTLLTNPTPTIDLPAALTDLAPGPTITVQPQEQTHQDVPTGSETVGLESLREHVRTHREAFPDWTEKIKFIVAEGDLVVINFVSTGTNEGSFMGNPPTKKSIKINEMSIFRIVDDKISEQWLLPDLLSLNQQLGYSSQQN